MTDQPSRYRCRLCLVTPSAFSISELTETLEQVLDAVDCASLLLDMDTRDPVLIEEAATELMGCVIGHDRAFMITDQAEIAAKIGADGVHLTDGPHGFEAARKTLGADRIIGIGGITSRHLAMLAGETGADYVAFGGSSARADGEHSALDLTGWWGEMFEVPAMVFCGGKPGEAEKLIAAGADFLCLGDAIWSAHDGPVAAAKRFERLMHREIAA